MIVCWVEISQFLCTHRTLNQITKKPICMLYPIQIFWSISNGYHVACIRATGIFYIVPIIFENFKLLYRYILSTFRMIVTHRKKKDINKLTFMQEYYHISRTSYVVCWSTINNRYITGEDKSCSQHRDHILKLIYINTFYNT